MIQQILVCDVCGEQGALESRSWVSIKRSGSTLNIHLAQPSNDSAAQHACCSSCVSKWVSHQVDEITAQMRNQERLQQSPHIATRATEELTDRMRHILQRLSKSPLTLLDLSQDGPKLGGSLVFGALRQLEAMALVKQNSTTRAYTLTPKGEHVRKQENQQ
jgi:hypothetical protein